MRMNFGLQQFNIKASLSRAGIDPEKFDVSAHIDRTLRYRENLTNIMGMHGRGRKRRDYARESAEEKARGRKARKKKGRQTGVSNEAIDKRYLAKYPGRRKSPRGKRYYERRSNRSDVSRTLRL